MFLMVMVILSGCATEKTPEVIIPEDPDNIKRNAVSFEIREEEGDFIYSASVPAQSAWGDMVEVPALVLRFYRYDSDNKDKELDRYAYSLGNGTYDIDLMIRGAGILENPYADFTDINGSFKITFYVDERRYDYEIPMYNAGIVTYTSDFVREIDNLETDREYLLGYRICSTKRIHADNLTLDALKDRTVITKNTAPYTVVAVTLEYYCGGVNGTVGWHF